MKQSSPTRPRASWLLVILIILLPVVTAVHVLGEDYPPTADTGIADAIMGQLDNSATSSLTNPQSFRQQINATIAEGTYFFSVKAQCTSGTTRQLVQMEGLNVENSSSAAFVILGVQKTISNGTIWANSVNAAYVSDWGINYASFNGTLATYTINIWVTLSQPVLGVGLSVDFGTCTAGNGRWYRNNDADNCSSLTGGANGAVVRKNGINLTCILNMETAFPSPPVTAAPRTLGGANGTIFGNPNDAEGLTALENLANSLGVSTAATELLVGIVFLILFTVGFGIMFKSGIAAGIGSVIGLVIDVVLGLIPIWLVVLLGVILIALLIGTRGTNGGGE